MIALITGVSREMGLGFSVARLLSQNGFRVIITARDESKAQAFANILHNENLDVIAIPMDVTSDESVENCKRYIADIFGSLDVLINNAVTGFDFEKDAIETDVATVRAAFETNVIGPWRVCTAFMPLLEKGSQPRIVKVSSEASSFSAEGGLWSPYVGGTLAAYSASKCALNAYTIKLAQSVKDRNILVNAVDPGFTATHPELGDQEGARSPQESAKGIVWAATLPSGGFFRDEKPLAW